MPGDDDLRFGDVGGAGGSGGAFDRLVEIGASIIVALILGYVILTIIDSLYFDIPFLVIAPMLV